eukprot:3600369-Prymnesium_polylepis.1
MKFASNFVAGAIAAMLLGTMMSFTIRLPPWRGRDEQHRVRAAVRAAHALDAAKLDGWIEAMLVLSPPPAVGA